MQSDPTTAVIISNGALMLFTGIVGGLTAAIGLLFRSLIASKDQQIEGWRMLYTASQTRESRLVDINLRQLQTGERVLSLREAE